MRITECLFFVGRTKFIHMTIAARRVLDDCRGAVDEIGNGVQGSAWRRRWVAAVVLLRTVGFVLSSVDSKISPEYKRAISEAWTHLKESKPQPEIFWGFIDAERHNIVHEYEVGAGKGVTIFVGNPGYTEDHYLVTRGPYSGRDQREILRHAIGWWETYLDSIDRSAKDKL